VKDFVERRRLYNGVPLPQGGRPITYSRDGQLQVRNHPIIHLLRGTEQAAMIWVPSVRVFDGSVVERVMAGTRNDPMV